MMVYIWGRRNENVRMSFLGLFPFRAPYLAWVLFFFSALLSGGWHSMVVDGIGIVAGHCYLYAEDIYPKVAAIRGWPVYRPLRAPEVLRWALGEGQVQALPDANGRPPPQPAGEVLMM